MKNVSEIYDIKHFDKGISVDKKEEATFIRLLISPDFTEDSLYRINDYYLDGKLKFTGKSKSFSLEVELEGPFIEFFHNGHKKMMGTFYEGSIKGDIREYFPNGKLNTIKTFYKNQPKNGNAKLDYNYREQLSDSLKTCLDSMGNVLTENGNGKWIEYHNDYKTPFAEGTVINGTEAGQWHGQINDSVKYVCKYSNGKLIEGKSLVNSNKEYPFKETYTAPEFKGGMDKFGAFLGKNIHYPADARASRRQGRVVLTFVVKNSGLISNIRVTKAVWPSLDMEAINAVKGMPKWTPCYMFGIPSSVSYNVPISFTLVND
ncbi:TonB family protein [Mucilaginibacter sp. RCC_168]|uniref:energy transducer TonB n=1 Tax=Mucilaginibacter sp. RCC_168 TaxID=3239221 RepID=UPI003525704E